MSQVGYFVVKVYSTVLVNYFFLAVVCSQYFFWGKRNSTCEISRRMANET